MFQPLFCPNPVCEMHTAPEGRFFQRDGVFHRLCQPSVVPRFRCKHCRKRFSRQTFRMNYRERRPELDEAILTRFVSGTGIRQIARMLRCHPDTVAYRLRKYGPQFRHFHHNTLGQLGPRVECDLDELETFEGCRRIGPVTVAIGIDHHSFFVFEALSETLPARGQLDARHRKLKQAYEQRHGRRQNGSAIVVRKVLELIAGLCREAGSILLRTDRKLSYVGIAKRAFGEERLVHQRTSSKDPRTTWNPLFRINLTNAMARDLMGRLHRRSWLVSKKRERLDDHLGLWMAYRNYQRPWKNGETESPAMRLGFVEAPIPMSRMIGWRQDFGPRRSIHPLSNRGETVRQHQRLRTRLSVATNA